MFVFLFSLIGDGNGGGGCGGDDDDDDDDDDATVFVKKIPRTLIYLLTKLNVYKTTIL